MMNAEVTAKRALGMGGNVASREIAHAVPKSHAERLLPDYSGLDTVQRQMSALLAMTFKLISERGSALIQLTAARAGDGTSTVAYELARVAALSKWCKVALIDTGTTASGPPAPGRAEADEAAELFLRPVQFRGANILVGQLNQTGAFGLQPDRVRECCSWLRSNFTHVIFDCPPVLGSADAANIAATADGTILVVDAERTDAADAERACDLLVRAGGTVIGVILNKRPQLPKLIERLK